MCGIAAIIGYTQDSEKYIKESLSKIIHRGSSNFEYVILERAALGTNRLPIVGRVNGKQPAFNQDKTIFAILNGEIFNHVQIRKSLMEKGHLFTGESDTEVLVHLYEEYGESMVEYIDSDMYAFIIFDNKNNDFFVVRDRYGVKPLYYAYDKNGDIYHFASELKQLTDRKDIDEIYDFPPGHTMKNGELQEYSKIVEPTRDETISDEGTTLRELTTLMMEAVKKRVETDLPIAVLLSGGVDSSLVMEIANRLHKDVTAYILGKPGSPDYEAALRLCTDYGYKYKIVYPDVDYAEEVDNIIYHLELYEAQVIRQAFSLDILARAIARDGYKIALTGDASDEIFGGYNEFIRLDPSYINSGCNLLTRDLSRSHNIRLDRMSMKHTLEIRTPFFDTKVIQYALRIDPALKIKTVDHKVITKYILRRVAEQFLPKSIAYRYKVPFSNGAGMNVGFNFKTQDGDVAQAVLHSPLNALSISQKEREKIGLITKEEEIDYSIYKKYGFNKLKGHEDRIITKETLSQIDQNSSITRVVIAEFGRMGIYFPIYLADYLGFFKKRNIEIACMSTGGDDLTYNALFSGSAQIGISDPIFSFSNSFITKGKIIGSLIHRVPVVAVSLNPSVTINNKEDFSKYVVGTFQEFSTTHTLVRNAFKSMPIHAIHHEDIIHALTHKTIDIAFIPLDMAYSLKNLGARILYSLNETNGSYLFTGITISDNLDPAFYQAIDGIKSGIKEAIVFLQNFQKESGEIFETMFPDILDPRGFLGEMRQFWHKKIDDVSITEINNAKNAWNSIYPYLLEQSTPNFIKQSSAMEIIHKLTSRELSREIPYREDALIMRIEESLKNKTPLEILLFWGASDKNEVTDIDLKLIRKIEEIKSIFEQFNITPEIKILFADIHGKMNGYIQSNVLDYIKGLELIFSERGYSYTMLSSIWNTYNITENEIRTLAADMSELSWSKIRIKTDLEKSATKRGHNNPIRAAQVYYIMRTLENKALKAEYPNAIHLSFSDDKLQEVFPDLPTIYIWPYSRGKIDQLPWFEK